MEKATFKFPTKEIDSKKNEVIKKRFSLNIPYDSYLSITALIGEKAKKGKYNYSLKNAFEDGLVILKSLHPEVSSEECTERRFYRGGKQKTKIESYNTSTMLFSNDINWIDNFIIKKRMENQFYSKTDFIVDLVDNLKKSK